MGFDDLVSMDEEMANSGSVVHGAENFVTSKSWRVYLTVLVVAGAIYLGCIVSPPSLMDDSDAVLAQAARTMLSSGDWVTARLDGVAYLEKPPLYYWPMTISYVIFGGHDWAARIPVALAAIGLAWLTAAMGVWAFGRRAGLYAGLCMATCVGLFLFTRVQIPDVMLTLSNGVAMWAILRALDEEESRPRLWAFLLAVSLGIGLLIKGLIAIALPVGTGVIYLFFTKELWARRTWQRLRPISGFFVALLIAAPWHILATLRNPPYFSFSLHSGPGQYHRFFLVLLHQRATAPVPESALIPRLQHVLAPLLLAVALRMAFSVEPVFSGCCKAFLQASGSCRADTAARAVLDRLRVGVFHVFHDAGVLLDVLLSCSGSVAGLGDGDGG